MLVRHEGIRLKMYVDSVGKTTIGIGHNLTDRGIKEATAYLILDDDISDATIDAQGLPFFANLDPVRQDVIVSLVFNIGIVRLRGFIKMLAALSDGNWEQAAAELLDSRYAQQVGNRALELAEMIKTGNYG